ncbi:hypothetical protein SAMN06265218_103165 [Fodinibius sediminis]|uniref:Uncharacterized protein n=1 Tax=Fodinibius sediminis TaxID=1214077 RepID=A0A521BJL9_9BACT|nr:hypothetical protein SAMN06265218_103165 [Fodinibius sediminis]
MPGLSNFHPPDHQNTVESLQNLLTALLFDRKAVIKVGGYLHNTVGEDMEPGCSPP